MMNYFIERANSKVFDERGSALVGILVASGIGVLVFGLMTQMMVTQAQDQRYLSQRLEMNDLTNSLISTFSKPSNCSCQFQNNASNPNLANYSVLLFDSTNTSGTEVIPVGNVYTGCLGGLFPPLLIAGDNQSLGGTRDLIVDTVKLVNLKPSGGAASNDWQGQWQIIFKVGLGSLSKASPAVLVTQKFTIDSTVPTAARISSCSGISSGTGTTNFLAKWSSIPGMLTDSGVFENAISGRVGLGTVAPDDSLEVVQGAGRGITSTRYGQVGPAGGAVRVRGSRGSQAAPTALMNNDYLGWFYSSGYNGLGFTTPGLSTSIGIRATENWNATNNGSKMTFLTTQNGTTTGAERMVISETGNVGIGTTTPTHRLSIQGDGVTDYSGAVNVGNGWDTAAGFAKGSLTSFNETTNKYQVLDIGGKDIRFSSSSDNTGAPGGPIAMFIQNTTGNVGIGTTAPRTALDIPNGSISTWFPGTNPTTQPVCYNGVTGIIDACVSLREFKKNIHPLDMGMNEILHLKPVSYEMKADGNREIGFIAEDVTAIDERFGQKSTEGKVVGVKYSQMVALLTKGIQELHEIDLDLSDEVVTLKAEAMSNKVRINQLVIENDKLKKENVSNFKSLLEIKAYLCSKDNKAPLCD